MRIAKRRGTAERPLRPEGSFSLLERGASAPLRRVFFLLSLPFLLFQTRSISPPWRGRPCPLKTDKDGGGLPNGARAKRSLATIKQGCCFNFKNAKRRGSAERSRHSAVQRQRRFAVRISLRSRLEACAPKALRGSKWAVDCRPYGVGEGVGKEFVCFGESGGNG